MAKILLVISIIVTAITAALGFMTKAKVEDIKRQRDDFRSGKEVAENGLAKKTAELKTKSDELVATQKDLDTQKAEVTKLTADVTKATEEAKKAKEDVDAGAAKIADLEKKIAAMPATPDKPIIGESADAPLRAEITKLQGELAEAQQVQKTLQQREKESADKLAEAERTVRQYRDPIDRAGTTGRVVAVNPGWNFVVVDVGDRKGATINAPLLVMRGNSLVGRLKITSVEPGTSIADVVPGSVTRGDSVQPGDKIVFAGRNAPPKEAAASDAKPAAGATKPAPGGAAPKLPEH